MRAQDAFFDSASAVEVQLGATGSAQDFSPTLSEDELYMVFASTRAGGLGGFDLYETQRPSAVAPWGPPQILPQLNSPQDDYEPTLSFDGLELYYVSTRPGGPSGSNIYMAVRPNTGAPWSPPQILPPPVNGPGLVNDDPHLTEDGLTMFFVNGSAGGGDIFTATRPAVGAPWGNVQNFAPANSPTLFEHSPTVEANGNIVWFSRLNAAGGAGSSDFMMVHRDSSTGQWSAPMLIPELNTSSWESNGFVRGITGRFYWSRFGATTRIWCICPKVVTQQVRRCIVSFLVPKIRSIWPIRIVWCRYWVWRIGTVPRVVWYDWWPNLRQWFMLAGVGIAPNTVPIPGVRSVGGLELDPIFIAQLLQAPADPTGAPVEAGVPVPPNPALIGIDLHLQSVGLDIDPLGPKLIWSPPAVAQIR